MPPTMPGDGLPGDGLPSEQDARQQSGPKPTKPPRHVPTFAAGSGGLLGPRLMVVLLALVVGIGTAVELLGQNKPATPDGSLLQPSPAATQAPANPASQTAEPTDDGPAGAPLPGSTTTPPPPKQAAPTSAPPEELTGYVWPLRGARVTSRFGPRDFGGFIVGHGDDHDIHDGLDLARFCGFKVRAAHDGVVLYAGRKFDDYLGYKGSPSGIYARLEQQGRMRTLPIVVVIDDGNGYRSVYVHLSQADVKAGDEVKAGDVIGREGATGFATGCHLHYALIRMDGPWEQVVPSLHQYGYPTLVRQRVDPLLVLPWDDPHAPERLRERVNPSSPSPSASPGDASPGSSPQPAEPGQPSPSASPPG